MIVALGCSVESATPNQLQGTNAEIRGNNCGPLRWPDLSARSRARMCAGDEFAGPVAQRPARK